MSEIQWTDTTWNPMVGCSKVSPGCRECYAETWAAQMVLRLRGLVAKGNASERTLSTLAAYERAVAMDDAGNPLPKWSGEVGLIPHKLAEPLSWRKPRMVFVNSMSDLFHESVPFEFIAATLGVMAACPQHTFQVLTKRPERAAEFFAWVQEHANKAMDTVERKTGKRDVGQDPCRLACVSIAASHVTERKRAAELSLTTYAPFTGEDWPLPNVWLGVSVENQAQADARIPQLLRLPAAARFVSAEPLLGPIDFGLLGTVPRDIRERYTATADMIDWVIVGGESGKNARPCDVEWIRGVVRQCSEAGVPCFVKQMGSQPVRISQDGRTVVDLILRDPKGGDPSEWPEDLRVREWPASGGGAE